MERHLGTGRSVDGRHVALRHLMCDVTPRAHHSEPSIFPRLELNREGRFLASRAFRSALLAGARSAVTLSDGRPLKVYLPFIHEMGLSAREMGAGVVVVVVVLRRLLRE